MRYHISPSCTVSQVPHLFSLFLVISILAGCTAQKYSYEKPLHDLQVLSTEEAATAGSDEISYQDIDDMQPGRRPPLESDEAGIWMVMDNVEADLKTSGHRYRDAELEAYVNEITAKVAPQYADDIRVYLVRVPYFNASMAPNGAMQIWTGLFLRVHNEAQLASVIGHEIAHYLRRHSLQRLRRIIDTTNSAFFLNVAAAMFGVPQAGQIIQLAAIGSLQAYGRDHEREADGYGLALLSRAGYDPRTAAQVWENLIREKEADEDRKTPPLFLSTHPASDERNEALKQLGEKIVSSGERRSFHLGKERYLAKILAHRKAFLRDELHLRNFDALEELLEILLEEGSNPAEIHYFYGELYRLRAEGDDLESALEKYHQALSAKGEPPPAMYKAMGRLYRKKGSYPEAVQAYQAYLDRVPDAFDRDMILHTIRRLNNETP